MVGRPTVRLSEPCDAAAIFELYPAAFPDEDLLPLVSDLLDLPAGVISLVATINDSVVGHIAFTDCRIESSEDRLSLLAPLAVAPDHQRGGIGSGLVREGMRLLEDQGVSIIYVLGDPAYYSRFGFAQENDVAAPYEIPAEWASAWQSLSPGGKAPPGTGQLLLPEVWMRRELWAA